MPPRLRVNDPGSLYGHQLLLLPLLLLLRLQKQQRLREWGCLVTKLAKPLHSSKETCRLRPACVELLSRPLSRTRGCASA